MRSWLLIAVLLPACIQDHLVPCGDLLCPVGSLCVQDTCVRQDQIDVCVGKPDGADCQVLDLPPGRCYGGVCHVPNCGNGFVDAPVEQCDDGNHIAGDGCSADCLSDETCGNLQVDPVNGEQCDEGIVGLSNDGCTSTCRAEFESWRDVTPSQLTARRRIEMVYDASRHEIVAFGGYSSGQPLGDTWVFSGSRWVQRFPPSAPEPRYGHTLAYDSQRHRVVLFGGTDGIVYHQSIWEWDGTEWTKRTFPSSPSPRRDAAMIYDPDHHEIVLYGGTSASGPQNDTWTFDGNAWTVHANLQLTPGSYAPPNPPFVTMFYDGIDHQVLLMAGHTLDVQPTIYTWSPSTVGWDNPLAGPPSAGFEGPAIASRPDGHPLWYGGRYPAASPMVTNATYEWIDGVWTPLTVSTAPLGARWEAGAAFDEDSNIVIFGGTTAGNADIKETWAMPDPDVTTPDGWKLISTTPLPPARSGAAAAYSLDDGDSAVFGGRLFGGDTNQLWMWSEPSWSVGPAVASPQSHVAITYDEDREATLMFGGVGCGSGSGTGSGSATPFVAGFGSGSGAGSGSDVCSGNTATFSADTYVLRHRTWNTPAPQPHPSARASAALAYDSDHHVAVLFGGQAATAFNDTWSWSGSAWSPLDPITKPPAMSAPRMIFDRAKSTLVLYGGAGALGTVWLFDGATWTEVTPATGPEPRNNPVFAYDARRQRGVLHGGVLDNGQFLDDTWEWNTATLTWTRRQPLQAPPVRQDAAYVYDALHGHVMLFGGTAPDGSLLDDVWVYGYESTEPGETCDDTDGDGDGLIGCADPDCWARCAPHCPPGAPCDGTQPHCGDHQCSTLESHALCPGDCP